MQLGIRYTITTLNKLPPPASLTEEHFQEKVGCGGQQHILVLAPRDLACYSHRLQCSCFLFPRTLQAAG